MMERLGDVLYWAGCAVAGLCVAAGMAVAFMMANSGNPTDVRSAPVVGACIAIAAILPWLAGRACRYIFSGR